MLRLKKVTNTTTTPVTGSSISANSKLNVTVYSKDNIDSNRNNDDDDCGNKKKRIYTKIRLALLLYRARFAGLLCFMILWLILIALLGPRQQLKHLPRLIYYIYGTTNTTDTITVVATQINPNTAASQSTKTKRKIYVDKKAIERQKELKNSRDRHFKLPDRKITDDGCEPQYEWQTQSYPICNIFHEIDTLFHQRKNNIQYIASGDYRDVWKIYDTTAGTTSAFTGVRLPLALKTLVYDRDYGLRNYDRHRRDTVVTARLSSSPYIASIYGSCVNSALYEFATGGTLEDIILLDDYYDDDDKDKEEQNESDNGQTHSIGISERKGAEVLNDTEKLIIGYHVAAAISDMHNVDKEGKSSIAHTDIKLKQIIYVSQEGLIKLTDFNVAVLIKHKQIQNIHNDTTTSTCPFTFPYNGGRYRAPEEYNYEPETEKVDVYTMGNVLYSILTGKLPFYEVSYHESKDLVKKGITPAINEKYVNTTNPIHQIFIHCMKKCWEFNPEKRATSREIEQYINNELQKQNLTTPNNNKLVRVFV